MSASRETKFEVDVGDVVVESIPPSRHAAANFSFDTTSFPTHKARDIKQDLPNLSHDVSATLLSPLSSSSMRVIGSARKEENQLVRN